MQQTSQQHVAHGKFKESASEGKNILITVLEDLLFVHSHALAIPPTGMLAIFLRSTAAFSKQDSPLCTTRHAKISTMLSHLPLLRGLLKLIMVACIFLLLLSLAKTYNVPGQQVIVVQLASPL